MLICGGAIAGQLPVMFIVYMAMSRGWLSAVATLSGHDNYGAHRPRPAPRVTATPGGATTHFGN